ncbi:hypothetical protein BDR07DRAFT_1384727 [Suillus spraguei]|nr:hypothetical protein BDR07DRAFT_1384727 [Suillus spraguei]
MKQGHIPNKKFNAEKTGGEPVIPSPNLDTDLVMNTGHNEEKEEKLLERCPPGHEGTKVVDKPATIIDVSGTIIAWYLPDALTETTQKEIRAATDLLGPSLEKSVKADGNWRYNQEWFKQGSENNLSDPEVSASLKGPSSENILKAIARPAAIASAALRVMHPQQYFAGLRALSHLGDKAVSKELPQMPETLQYWASMFNSLSIISNRETPNHRDHLSIPECFDILTTVGNYSNARMSMPSLQLEFRIVRHGVDGGEGDRIAWAWTRDSILEIRDSMIDSPNSGFTLGTQESVRQHNPAPGLRTDTNVKNMNSHIAAGARDSGLRTM